MKNKKELNEIADGVAEVTLELMYDTVQWQIADFPQDGDDYSAIHDYVMKTAIKKLKAR